MQKREYVRWTPEEEESFYSALKGVAGQKPEICLKQITLRVASKDYAQVGICTVFQRDSRHVSPNALPQARPAALADPAAAPAS